MSFIYDLADRIPSGSGRTQTRFMTALVVVLVLLPAMTGVVAAAPQSSDFICSTDTKFSTTMQGLLTLFVVGGPVIGSLFAAYATVARAGNPDGDWDKKRKKALVSGWTVPLLVYLVDVIDVLVLGVELHCLMPGA